MSLKQLVKRSRVLSRAAWIPYREWLLFRSLHPSPGTIPKFHGECSLKIVRLRSFEEYQAWEQEHAEDLKNQREIERALVPSGTGSFHVPGFCALCGKATTFRGNFAYRLREPDGRLVPNFRENLNCQHCGLKTRSRAFIHAFIEHCHPTTEQPIYATEQVGQIYVWLKGRYKDLVGSEYKMFPGPFGSVVRRIRNEDLAALTWADESFDFILSADVLEHVPELIVCLKQILRCLKPGGRLLFTVPFDLNRSQTLVRAKLNETGEIVHLTDPEYHGGNVTDPSQGTLAFRTFGWDILQQLADCGFRDAETWLCWSRELGYLGPGMLNVVTARKP